MKDVKRTAHPKKTKSTLGQLKRFNRVRKNVGGWDNYKVRECGWIESNFETAIHELEGTLKFWPRNQASQ
jgi:hypothetical protein